MNRLTGLVRGLDAATSSSRLHALAHQGVITTEEVEAWRKLRNKLSHGTLPEFGQMRVDNAHHVLTLFHRLVLHCVGFSGELRDYGESDWPLVKCGSATGSSA